MQVTTRPRRESDRMVTERARHIYDLGDVRNRYSDGAPIGYCGRRIKTGDFVAGLSVEVYRRFRSNPLYERFKSRTKLTRDLCPACEDLVAVPMPLAA